MVCVMTPRLLDFLTNPQREGGERLVFIMSGSGLCLATARRAEVRAREEVKEVVTGAGMAGSGEGCWAITKNYR